MRWDDWERACLVVKGGYDNIRLVENGNTVTVELNRPDVHNAFNDSMIAELEHCFALLGKGAGLDAVILTGNGKSFCAGADLNWMRRMAQYGRKENIEDAGKMAAMFEAIASCPMPTIARVNGAAYGGGVGLVAVCDFAVSSESAKFAFSEVNLGLIPAVISQFVIDRIGPVKARQLFMSGERFEPAYAFQIGLVDLVAHDLDGAIDEIVKQLATSGKGAVAASKELVAKYGSEDFMKYCIEAIADIRASEEGKEGVRAFLEKRKPKWRLGNDR